MGSRTRRMIAAASAAALASTTTVVAIGEGTAQAKAAPSPWIQLSSGGGVELSYQPRVLRWKGRLLVVWTQDTDRLHSTLNSRLLSNKGKPINAVTPALSPAWSTVSADPAPFLLGGVPTIAFSGIHSLYPADPRNGHTSFVQAADASSWALGRGWLTDSQDAFADYGLGAVDDGTGQPVTAGVFISRDHVTVHHGIDTTVPGAAPDIPLAPTGTDPQNANVARDLKTNVTYAIWYSPDSGARQGIRAAQIWPTQSAPMAPAPLSTVHFNGARKSINNLQDVGIVGRIGGGVWAAYSSGYPSPHTLVLWKVGTTTTLTLHTTGEVQYPTVAAAPGGRLWVSWIEGSQVRAVRTNPAVTKWGIVRTLDAPDADDGGPTHVAGDGQLGPLDMAITSGGKPLTKGGVVTSQIYSARIYEQPRVTVSPAKVSSVRGGTVVVTVTDAGVPVKGILVRIGSTVLVTGSSGKVSFAVVPPAKKGRVAVTVTGAGWWPASTSFKVG